MREEGGREGGREGGSDGGWIQQNKAFSTGNVILYFLQS